MRVPHQASALWRFRHRVNRRGNSGSGKLFEKEEAASEYHRNGKNKDDRSLSICFPSKIAFLRSSKAADDPAYCADDAVGGERGGEGCGNAG